MKVQHYYVDSELNDDSAYKQAMKFACELAEKDPNVKRVILLASTKKTVSWLERAFSDKIVKDLFKGLKFEGCKPLYKIETVQTYKQQYSAQDIIITMAIDDKDVLPLNDMHSVIAIIAIPWQKSGLKQYLETWNPIDIRSNKNFKSEIAQPNCIVIKALEQLTNSINLSNGINHPSDNTRAKTTVLALHKYETSLDADLVKSYLTRVLHWENDVADELAGLIRTLNAGKFFKGGDRTGLQNHYKGWKQKCEEES
ncbi:hypothetical protein [Pedobacter alluvionis]|uniref:Uncharacterized protein n=1 Tax=Pedobacter alluvionis TaxID=475253 RepID=A0A497Y5U3_9SPHI|nr:hypothetical protein [Pedobacter alluvionis]RLJ77346.1 hypothetical protein BCL90_2431 [Pedobacter alluvionis]TFB33432.1 hypothetical protein E3V97_05135 [Pedobacter alluvionis]